MDTEKIDPQDTNVIMHVYRGELQRINAWRQRMDRTTNWAIVITVGVLTFSLSTPSAPHWTLFPGLFLSYILLMAEARRYRHYDAWRGRVRALEEIFLAKFFDQSLEVDEEWQELLSADFRKPSYKISWEEAVKRRIKRIYIWILLIYLGAWTGKIYIHPETVTSLSEFFTRVSEPLTIGIIAFSIIIGIILGPVAYFFISSPKREAKGKIRPKQTMAFTPEEYCEED